MDSDPLDDLGSWKEVVRPTKKPRSVDPHKSKPIQTTKKTTTTRKYARRIENPGVLLYRYLRTVETRTRNPGVMINRVPKT